MTIQCQGGPATASLSPAAATQQTASVPPETLQAFVATQARLADTPGISDRLRLASYAREVSAELRKVMAKVAFLEGHLAKTSAALDAAREEADRIRGRLERPDMAKVRRIRLADGADDMSRPFALGRPGSVRQ